MSPGQMSPDGDVAHRWIGTFTLILGAGQLGESSSSKMLKQSSSDMNLNENEFEN